MQKVLQNFVARRALERFLLTSQAQSMYYVPEKMTYTKKKYCSKKFKASTSPFILCRRTRISTISGLRFSPNRVLSTLILVPHDFWNQECMISFLYTIFFIKNLETTPPTIKSKKSSHSGTLKQFTTVCRSMDIGTVWLGNIIFLVSGL